MKVPAKTFIFGEYGVLRQGPALVFLSEPSFELRLPAHLGPSFETVSTLRGLFHPDSPVGRLIQDYLSNSSAAQFVGHDKDQSIVEVDSDESKGSNEIEFFDPYNGRGGLGGSTAEYLSVYEWIYPSHSVWQMLASYRAHADQGGQRPSGMDIVAQSQGGLCLVDESQSVVQSMGWPFREEGIAIFRTGQKLKTHEHLTGLGPVDFDTIKYSSKKCDVAFQEGTADLFATALNEFYGTLNKQGLQAASTQQFVAQLLSHPHIMAAKGCGAMGVDFILCMYRKSSEQSVVECAINLGLELASTLEQMSPLRMSSPFYIQS